LSPCGPSFASPSSAISRPWLVFDEAADVAVVGWRVLVRRAAKRRMSMRGPASFPVFNHVGCTGHRWIIKPLRVSGKKLFIALFLGSLVGAFHLVAWKVTLVGASVTDCKCTQPCRR